MDLAVARGECAGAVEDECRVERTAVVRPGLVERARDDPHRQASRGVGEGRGELAVDRLGLRLALGRPQVVHVLGQHRHVGAGGRGAVQQLDGGQEVRRAVRP
jgi:hypothetical protein